MRDYFKHFVGHVDEAWLSGRALARLHALTSKLPVCAVGGLEVRLGQHEQQVDFFCRLPGKGGVLWDSDLKGTGWPGVDNLARRVAPGGLGEIPLLEFVTLEFDLGQDLPPMPMPSVFLQLGAGTGTPAGVLADTVLRVHDLLGSGASPPHGLQSVLMRVAGLCTVAHCGVMLSRPGHALRLVLAGLRWPDVPRLLHRLGSDALQQGPALELLHDLARVSDRDVLLNIDVSDRLGPRVGIEFYARPGQEPSAARWQSLWARLTALGLACPQKCDALLMWPGLSECTRDAFDAAVGSQPAHWLMQAVATSVVWRNLNHVKVSVQEGAVVDAKAYLGFGHNWLRREPIDRAD